LPDNFPQKPNFIDPGADAVVLMGISFIFLHNLSEFVIDWAGGRKFIPADHPES
jgi:hypothetical protein